MNMTVFPCHRAPFRLRLVRVAVISALGVQASMWAGQARAACQTSSSSGAGIYTVCYGANEQSGEDLVRSLDGARQVDVSGSLSLDTAGNVGGVYTLYTRGGRGVDARNAGRGGSVTLNTEAQLDLVGSTHGGFYRTLISVSSVGGHGDENNDDNNSDGGDGGAGGALDIENSGKLAIASTVQPHTSAGNIPLYGISAISAGGKGGEQNNSAFGNQVGGLGGAGGSIAVRNKGSIELGTPENRLTGYVNTAAIRAQSLGGGGGPDNGAAGMGGSVDVVNTGHISVAWSTLDGVEAFGIQAISAGGDGSESNDDSDNGGAGGSGGEVRVLSSGQILVDLTESAGSYTGEGAGVAALSQGGKGGIGPKSDHTGGKGGMGQHSSVQLEGADSRITTRGRSLYGILAQSLGGEGGDGKDSAALAGQGGGAGFGGNASSVAVSIDQGAVIDTEGAFSTGVIAQSVGGGGGTGGTFVSVLGGQGGNGGSGGDASSVGVNSAGTVKTNGFHAHGILAQSIAGSGGAGGVEVSASVALGGDGAGGGTAGQVAVVQQGDVSTIGSLSHGILAQSIGGGGGSAGSSMGTLSIGGNAAGSTGSKGGDVGVTNAGRIRTSGSASAGIMAQSIGGGGGSGGDSLGIVSVGGSGAAGGDGGKVSIFDFGRIETVGRFSPGVVAQSIGGGGGSGGDTLAISTGVTVGIGGSGAGGGDGGALCLSNEGACDNTIADGSREISTLGAYSPGIIAQNIGGGGGTGGSVTTVSVASFAGLQVGGSGGGGGNAGSAGTTLDYRGLNIRTGGVHSAGILAQSIGGGGGSGGNAASYNAGVAFNAALVMGGSGAAGGTGASTKVALKDSHVATGMGYTADNRDHYAPNESFGILAQTIGGGGGNGGSASAATLLIAVPLAGPSSPPVSFNFQSTIGGKGGAGGHACPSGDSSCLTQIALSEGSSVTTVGDGSHALLAQSIGGGGGNGGDSSALSVGIGYGESVSASVGVSLGGDGGQASHGGKVDIALGEAGAAAASLPDVLPDLTEPRLAAPGSILTYGDHANGVLAQSIGGGGGNGGTGSSNAYSAGGLVSLALNVALGGKGGAGGNGGETTATLHPNFVIHTAGSGSRGMLAQSIGGGGGTSQGGTVGMSTGVQNVRAMAEISLGREGGQGGDGGKVNARVDGAIRTEGGDADGVVLQSIGGGGGVGGSAGADATSYPILDRIGASMIRNERINDDGVSYQLNVEVGGRGGEGGVGGDVNVVYAGRVATQGDWADGLIAQSIGGGGGMGGSSTAAGSRVSASINLALGGVGGQGGHGGTVVANFQDDKNISSIRTEGFHAYGVVLQSIGGGGGLGGDGSDKANGQIAVGGSSGGSGGTAGVGGLVRAGTSSSHRVNIETLGPDAVGLIAQSIGGGGGIGGAGNTSASLTARSHSIEATVGGRGGVGNHGGEVTSNFVSRIVTQGDRAHALVAQSIGGGGGVGGSGDAGKLKSVVLGGRGAAGGDGGALDIYIAPASSILTRGAGAHGVIAQSIGGGGGLAGDASRLIQLNPDGWIDGRDGGSGSGNSVSVVASTANIVTEGKNAFGIIAQSIGGGGGIGGDEQGGFAGSTSGADGSGRGGAVSVKQSGTLSTPGEGSTGIFAQSTGPDGGGQVSVQVQETVAGGTGPEGNAVWVAQGSNNSIMVGTRGQILAGTGGSAVRYTGTGSDTSTLTMFVEGLVQGNVRCENAYGGVNGCDVRVDPGGRVTGASVYQAKVDNSGSVVIGTPGGFEQFVIEGDYSQQAGAEVVTEVDFAQRKAGQLVVRGDARLAGNLKIQAGSLLPGRELAVLTVDGHSVGSLKVNDSPIYDFALRQDGKTHRVSVARANFGSASPALERNLSGVAGHLQDVWDRGGSEELGRLFAVLHDTASDGPQVYRERLSDLSLGTALAPAGQMTTGMTNFMSAMMSCQTLGRPASARREQNCFWGQATRRNMDHDGGEGAPDYAFDTTTYQFGGQYQFRPNWFVGGSVAYQDSRLRGGTGRVNGKGDAGFAGVVLKHQAGPWVYSASLAGGYGAFRLNRYLGVQDYEHQTTGKPKVYTVGAKLRAARTFDLNEQVYVKPYVDLDALYTRMSGYTEFGGPLGLSVDASDQFVVGLSPMIEVGGHVGMSDGSILRPFAYAGATLASKDSWSTVSRLNGAPAGASGFSTTLPSDHVTGKFGVGLHWASASGVDIRLQYDGEASSKARSHAGQLRMMYRF